MEIQKQSLGVPCPRSAIDRLTLWLMGTYPLSCRDAASLAVWLRRSHPVRSVREYQAYCRAHFHRVLAIHQPRTSMGLFTGLGKWKWTRARRALFTTEILNIGQDRPLPIHARDDRDRGLPFGKREVGRILDGKIHDAYPSLVAAEPAPQANPEK